MNKAIFVFFLILFQNFVFSQSKELVGKYTFYFSTTGYSHPVYHIDNEGNAHIFGVEYYEPDRLSVDLELKADSSFYLYYFNSHLDCEMSQNSYGVYVIKEDTLILYSTLPKGIKLKQTPDTISQDLFKISFKGWSKRDLFDYLNEYKFYSFNKSYDKKPIFPEFTEPDKKKLEIEIGNVTYSNDLESISFIFKRNDIEDYLFFYNESSYKKTQKPSHWSEIPEWHVNWNRGSFFLDMSEMKSNSYYANDSGITAESANYFHDVSDFSFIIEDGVSLKSIHQTFNSNGQKYHIKLKKTDAE